MSINTKHTPEKWVVRKQRKSGIGNTGFGFAILLPLITKDGEYKGQVGGYHVVLHQDAGLSEKEANSICDKHNEELEKAAAPDLLEGAKNLLSLIETFDQQGYFAALKLNNEYRNLLSAYKLQCKDAIKKATE